MLWRDICLNYVNNNQVQSQGCLLDRYGYRSHVIFAIVVLFLCHLTITTVRKHFTFKENTIQVTEYFLFRSEFFKIFSGNVQYWIWSEVTMINIEDLTFQSSTQRDFVIMATRTPQREESTSPAGNPLDKEWVTEHARQVLTVHKSVLCDNSRVWRLYRTHLA